MKNRRLQFPGLFAPVLFALAMAVAPLQARAAHYLPDGQPDAILLLAPPPLPGSPEEAADLAEVRSVCRAAPTNDVSAAMAERKFSVFTFAPAIGDFFQPGKYPKTGQFFHQVQKDAANATDDAKEFWKRPRPYVLDPTLAAGKLEKSFSYPSGHSTESMVLALVLADLFPDKRDAILAEARRVGWHRVEIARHYPTDIYAGRVFAQAIVREMKKNPAFQADFAAVKAEIAALPQAARN
ncbi:MAG: phosphatase PAP2 family protein [Limisphaerales bacterium]